VRAPSPKGPKVTADDIEKWNKAAELSNAMSEKVENIMRETEDLDKIR